MKQKNQSPPKDCRDSRKTDVARELFTVMLATVALSAAGFGIITKMGRLTEGFTFTTHEETQEVPHARSTFREFSQETNRGENPPLTKTAYDMILEELQAGNVPAPELYLAASMELLARGAGSDARAIIQSAVIAHPGNSMIAMGSFDIRAATGQAGDVWTDLAQTGDTSNPEIMSRLIKYATVADKVDETMTILGDLELLPWPPSAEDWSNLVSALTSVGRYEDAKNAVDLSPEKKTLKKKLEASEKLAKGDFEKALEKMDEYAGGTKKLTAEDWAIYAEIHTELGNYDLADAAYKEAESLEKIEVRGGKSKG